MVNSTAGRYCRWCGHDPAQLAKWRCNDAEQVWECDDDCPHPSHEEQP